MQLARLRYPLVAHDASRKFRQPGVELGTVSLAPACNLPEGRDAEVVQHALEHGTDADDELEVVGLAHAGQDRRRRFVLDVDHELAIARAFLPGGGKLGCHGLVTPALRFDMPHSAALALCKASPKHRRLVIATADNPGFLHADALDF